MNGEQFFSLIGDLDDTLVLAAARPPRRQNVISMWWLTAAAALVIGVIGYTGVMRATEQTPPVQPTTPIVAVTTTTGETTQAVTTTTGETTQDTPSSTPSSETGESTTDTSTVIPSGSSKPSTTTSYATSTTPFVSTTFIFGTTTNSDTTAPTTVVPPVTSYPTSTTTANPTGPIYTCTTTVSSTTVATTTHVPPTNGVSPDGRPLLNSDGYVVTDRAYGDTDYVYGFSFEELEVQSITTAPVTLPVYAVKDTLNGRPLEVIVRSYANLVGDTIHANVSTHHTTRAAATGERFYYNINRDAHNYVQLRLNDPLPLTTPDNWLSEVMTYCPELFQHMRQPALFLSNGSRGWNKEFTDSPATAQGEVTFHAFVYDASNDPDGVANWLNGVSLVVEDGKLVSFLVISDERYYKVGDYPILSIEEATALAHKQCETLKARDVINEDYTILSTELVYMPHSGSNLRVPLYRFLVTADQTDYMSELRAETGLVPFYAVYVSAIPADYWTPESTDRFITQK